MKLRIKQLLDNYEMINKITKLFNPLNKKVQYKQVSECCGADTFASRNDFGICNICCNCRKICTLKEIKSSK